MCLIAILRFVTLLCCKYISTSFSGRNKKDLCFIKELSYEIAVSTFAKLLPPNNQLTCRFKIKNSFPKNFLRLLLCLGLSTCWCDVIKLQLTFRGYPKGGAFTTNVPTKLTIQIYEKLSYQALKRHFCQTAVTCWASFRSTICCVKFAVSLFGCLVALLYFLALVCALEKNTNVQPNSLTTLWVLVL